MNQSPPDLGWQTSVLNISKRIFKLVELPYIQSIMTVIGVVVILENQSPAYFLAEAMYYETWDEPYFSRSRQAIAALILNRTKDEHWPNQVEFVVKESKKGTSCTFSYRCDGYPNNPWSDGQDRWFWWLIVRGEANWYFFLHHYWGITLDPTDGALYYKRQDNQSEWFNQRLKDYRLTKVPGDFGQFEFFWGE